MPIQNGRTVIIWRKSATVKQTLTMFLHRYKKESDSENRSQNQLGSPITFSRTALQRTWNVSGSCGNGYQTLVIQMLKSMKKPRGKNKTYSPSVRFLESTRPLPDVLLFRERALPLRYTLPLPLMEYAGIVEGTVKPVNAAASRHTSACSVKTTLFLSSCRSTLPPYHIRHKTRGQSSFFGILEPRT